MRPAFKATCCRPLDELLANAEANRKLGYPILNERRLAVAGGGPLLEHDLEELRTWQGDIWAINYTAHWLHSKGIKSTLITIDPEEFNGEIPVDEAIVATCVHRSTMEKLKGKKVEMFDLAETHEHGIPGSITTATRIPALSLQKGYREVHFFGVEGSYVDSDHVDRHENDPEQLLVQAGENVYRVRVGLFIQCEQLALLFKNMGMLFKNRSGGLLKAMIEHPDTWAVIGASEAVRAKMPDVFGGPVQIRKAA